MSLPRMSLHIGDYLKDTRHLRADGHGAYLLLIMHYWTTGGLPSDDAQLASIASLSDKDWRRLRSTLRAFFDPGWRHKRIDAELADAKARYEKRVAAGKKGGNAKANGKQCSSNASPMPEAMTKQPITLTGKELEDGGRGERGRASLISPEADKLATELAAIAGYPDPQAWPPGWCGSVMRVQAMLNEGWLPAIILAAVRAAAARKRDGPAGSLNYFEKAIARAHAQQADPLPTVEIRESETTYVNRPQPQNNIIDAADRLIDSINAFGPRPGGEPGAADVRLLSEG